MDRLRNLFSRQQLPKILLIAAVYMLGRMEGEGRFKWSDVLSTAWDKVSVGSTAALDSARGVVGM